MPMIQKVMTTMPHTVGAEVSLKQAKQMMSEYGIRHLPVQQGGDLVGILSDRDISLAATFSGSENMKVADVMMPMTFVVRPETPLNEVAVQMSENKYGSAIVQQSNGKIVGIFTAVDALRVLAEILEQNYRGI